MGDEGLMYSGGENAYPFNTIATPAPRGHVPQMSNKKQGEASAGFMLMKPLVETATAAGVRALYDVRVQRLIVESDGRVVGLVRAPVRHGRDRSARAAAWCWRRAASPTTTRWWRSTRRDIAGRPAASIEQHDGQAIRMAQALGADLAHMDATEVAIFIDPQQTGARHPRQRARPALRPRGHLPRPDRPADALPPEQHGLPDHRRGRPGGGDGVAVAAVDDAPADVGVRDRRRTGGRDRSGTRLAAGNGRRLQRRCAARGEDPLLHKKPEWLKPIGSPVGAIDLRESTGGFTLGGLQTTLDAEVLHVSGEPIPGLFAAGRCTAGLAAWGYASGISLGDGSFYGRRAGRAAAKG